MTAIGFIGLGNMGLPMALNLLKAGHSVNGYDLNARRRREAGGCGRQRGARSRSNLCASADVVITMLPAGPARARGLYSGRTASSRTPTPATLLIDCSTIDVETRARGRGGGARRRACRCSTRRCRAASAGAEAGDAHLHGRRRATALSRARKPILETMGKTIVHAGGAGNGQAAKICNNMILGVSMIAVSEAFVLAEKLGLDAQKLFDIASKSSGQCWSMTSYCPGAGTGADVAGEPRLSGRLHGRDDAEGPASWRRTPRRRRARRRRWARRRAALYATLCRAAARRRAIFPASSSSCAARRSTRCNRAAVRRERRCSANCSRWTQACGKSTVINRDLHGYAIVHPYR